MSVSKATIRFIHIYSQKDEQNLPMSFYQCLLVVTHTYTNELQKFLSFWEYISFCRFFCYNSNGPNILWFNKSYMSTSIVLLLPWFTHKYILLPHMFLSYCGYGHFISCYSCQNLGTHPFSKKQKLKRIVTFILPYELFWLVWWFNCMNINH